MALVDFPRVDVIFQSPSSLSLVVMATIDEGGWLWAMVGADYGYLINIAVMLKGSGGWVTLVRLCVSVDGQALSQFSSSLTHDRVPRFR
jgi:hypothetical protein